jgi:hypothetical protein
MDHGNLEILLKNTIENIIQYGEDCIKKSTPVGRILQGIYKCSTIEDQLTLQAAIQLYFYIPIKCWNGLSYLLKIRF